MSSLLTIATAIALLIPGCSGFTSHPSKQLTRGISAPKPSPSAVHVLPDSIIETTSQIVSVLPDSMSSPESARGYFGLWFFGGQGGATVALSRAPAQIAKFKKLYSMADEGPSLGGETVGISPICLYPRDLCKADVDKVVSNKLSVEQMVEKGPKPTYLSENGYLNYASFVDANKGCNPLTVRAVFDSFATSDNVAPDVAQKAIDEFKRAEALEKVLDETRKHANIADFFQLDTDIAKLEAEIKKAADQDVFEEKGAKLPVNVLQLLVLIEDTINEVTPDQKKKMSKNNSQSYNKVKQKFRKFLSSTGDDNMVYENQVKLFREAPPPVEEVKEPKEKKEKKAKAVVEEAAPEEQEDYYDEEEPKKLESEEEEEEEELEDSQEDSESDDEIREENRQKRLAAKRAARDAAKAAEKQANAGEEEEQEYYDEEYDEEEGEADASDEDNVTATKTDSKDIDPKLKKRYLWLWKDREEMTPEERRWKWVKKENMPADLIELMDLLSRKKQKVKKEKIEKTKETDVDQNNLLDEEEYITQVKSRNDLTIDYTVVANVKERLEVLKQERFKGKYALHFHVEVLTRIADQFQYKDNDLLQIRLKVQVLVFLVGTLLQTAKQGVLSRVDWLETHARINELNTVIKKPVFVKSLKEAHTVQAPASAAAEEEENPNFDSQKQFDIERQVFPSLSNFVEGLHEQLWRAYQNLSHVQIEYLQRIQDENLLLNTSNAIYTYLGEWDQPEYQARIAIIMINYLYYKNTVVTDQIKLRLAAQKAAGKDVFCVKEGCGSQMVEKLVKLVHQWGNPRQRVRATLQQVYNLAIHNKLREARDLMMKTHMSQIIGQQNIDNQIMYNRALVQIGLAAFRLGKIKESHEILADICQNTKHKELLAQRISTAQDKTAEFEAEEKKRQIPFHFTINIQLLECVHHISSMLLEIPQSAQNQFTLSKTPVSRTFKRLIEHYDNQAFHLAAESHKDYIVRAARALDTSNWKDAVQSIFSINLFAQILDYNTEQFKQNLTNAFKKAALESFLYRAAKQYKSFELKTLQEMFGMDKVTLKKILGNLIIYQRLQMSLDLSRELLVVDEGASDIKELQQLSLQYVSQIQVIVSQNEHVANVMNVTQNQTNSAIEKAKQQAAQAANKDAAPASKQPANSKPK